MTPRRNFTIFVLIFPALTGGFLWLAYFVFHWFPDNVLYIRISFGILGLIIGVILSIILITIYAINWQLAHQAEKRISNFRLAENAAHYQFLYRLDHELKNPLTSLQVEISNLEEVLPDFEPDDERRHTLQRIKEQTKRLNDLVLQMRKLAELNNRPMEFTPVDMEGLLTDLVSEIQLTPAGMERKIILNLPQVPWPLPKFRGEADLLFLALHNVLDNSIKFTSPQDSIHVRAFEDSDKIVIEIADTGPGISDEEQSHVWEELFRGKTARGTPGSGLGLALVKAIIELHGGDVSFRSRLNQGTIVTLKLPNRL